MKTLAGFIQKRTEATIANEVLQVNFCVNWKRNIVAKTNINEVMSIPLISSTLRIGKNRG